MVHHRFAAGPGRGPLVVLVVGAALLLACCVAVMGALAAHVGGGYDDRQLDRLEREFDRGQAAFIRAETRMRQLASAHPRAVRIGWTLTGICVSHPGQADACTPTSPDDRATFAALPTNVAVVVRQSHDPGRTFFRFFANHPLRYTIMHTPHDTDVEAYARHRGFRAGRSLERDWALLGPIPDENRADDQWQ